MRIGIDVQTLETHERTRGIGKLCVASINALIVYKPAHQYFLFGFGAKCPDALNRAVEQGATYVQICCTRSREELLAEPAGSDFLWTTPAARMLDVYLVTSPFMFDIVLPGSAPCPIACVLLDAIPAVMHERGRPIYDSLGWARYNERSNLVSTYQRFLAISHSAADDCSRLLELPARLIDVTYVPIEQWPLRTRSTDADKALNRYGLKPGYVISISGYNFRKNITGTLATYARLSAQTRKQHPLVIVCGLESAEREDVEQQIAKLGIGGQVILTGYVPDELMPALLSNAGAMLFVSLYEGFGLPLAEAMAAGTAVVTADNSSLPEVVGPAAHPHEADDQKALALELENVLSDPDERARRIAEGFLQVAKFSPGNYARRVLDSLERVVTKVLQVSAELPAGMVHRIALVSPNDEYTVQLLRHLPESVEVHWFGETKGDIGSQRVVWYPHHSFARMLKHSNYDVVVYELGVGEEFDFVRPFMRAFPGIVVLRHVAAARDIPPDSHGVILHSSRAAEEVCGQSNVPIARLSMGAGFNYVMGDQRPRSQTRKSLTLSDDAFVILVQEDKVKVRDLEVVLSAIVKFCNSKVQSYVIPSDKLSRQRLKYVMDFFRRTGLLHRVRLPRIASAQDAYDLYPAVDVVVDLSADASVFSMAALAFAKPVIAQDDSDFAELSDSVCFKFGGLNASDELLAYLRELSRNSATRQLLGENAQAFARSAAWHLVADEFIKVIESFRVQSGTGEPVAL